MKSFALLYKSWNHAHSQDLSYFFGFFRFPSVAQSGTKFALGSMGCWWISHCKSGATFAGDDAGESGATRSPVG